MIILQLFEILINQFEVISCFITYSEILEFHPSIRSLLGISSFLEMYLILKVLFSEKYNAESSLFQNIPEESNEIFADDNPSVEKLLIVVSFADVFTIGSIDLRFEEFVCNTPIVKLADEPSGSIVTDSLDIS